MPATQDNVAKFEARRAELEATAAPRRSPRAQARGEALAALGAVEIAATAGEEGKLLVQWAPAISLRRSSPLVVKSIKPRCVCPKVCIRELGEFEIMIQVHAEVSTSVAIHIVAE